LKIRLIRNATLLLDYAGHRILIDPYFADKHALPSYSGKSANPTVDLPLPPAEILQGVELVVVSHLHSDHFDRSAQQVLPKELPVYCQPGDDVTIRANGFVRVTPIDTRIEWDGITIHRTAGQHGTGEVERILGSVSGFVFQAEREPTLYWTGDTILCDEVRSAISRFDPEVVVTHSGGATWPDDSGVLSPIIMGIAQTLDVCRLVPFGQVVATHLEALDHCATTRAHLRESARLAGISDVHLRIPADGAWVAWGPILSRSHNA